MKASKSDFTTTTINEEKEKNGFSSEAESCSSSTSYMDAAEHRYEKILRMNRAIKNAENVRQASSSRADFQVICRTLHFPDKNVKIFKSVLAFWEEHKNEYAPELYEISQVIFASPATQVSVERLFSLLHEILTSRRSRLKSSTIDKILFLKVNLDTLLRLKELMK